METLRKAVESFTGDAGTNALARQQQAAAEHTAGGETTTTGATSESRQPLPSEATPTTTTTEHRRAPVVEEPGSPPVETRRSISGRSDTETTERKTMEPTTAATAAERREGVLRTGETPLELDKERQKREEEALKKQRETREWSESERDRPMGSDERVRGEEIGRERGFFGGRPHSPEPYRRPISPRHEEEKPGLLERTKEFFTGGSREGGGGITGAFRGTIDTEETRQLGLEKGQVPYEHPEESDFVRRRYMDERRAIESGHVYEGQRLKDPEFYRSTFLRTPTEEYESERRWAQRRASLGYDDTEHITRAGAAVTPRGGVASVLGKVTHALGIPVQTTTTKYPLCLRSIVHPRKDTHDSKIEGDIILVQDHPGAPTQVIGSVRGINPGLHGLVILENGDLSLERSSAGLHFDAPGSLARHGGANTKERHLGDLGNIIVKDDGVSFFNFRVANLPLIDVAGRALAVMSGEDDLGGCGTVAKGVRHRKCGPDCRGAAGGCYACISDRTGNAGHSLGLGVLVRTDLLAMERLKNIHLGVGVGDETHSEESLGSTFGGPRREERQAAEYGLPGRQAQDLPEREREVRGGEFVALPVAGAYGRETVGRPSYREDEEEIARRRKQQQQLEEARELDRERQRQLEAQAKERDRQRQLEEQAQRERERDRQRQLEAQSKERERQRKLEEQERAERERLRRQQQEREERLERERRAVLSERERAEKERVEHQRMERAQAERSHELRDRQAQLERQAEAERQQMKERERQIQMQREREIKEQRQRQLEMENRERRQRELQERERQQRAMEERERREWEMQKERERQRQYELQKDRERQRQYELQKERDLYEQKSRSEAYAPARTGDYYSVERFEHPERVTRSRQGEDIGGKIQYFGPGARPAASGRSAHADY